MNTKQQRMAAIFNEWARRYAESPDDFSPVLDEDGKPVEGYGDSCARFFEAIEKDMDANGLLPIPGHVPVPDEWPDPPIAA